MRLGTLVALLALLAAGPAPAQESTAEARRLEEVVAAVRRARILGGAGGA